jgi:thioredoxin reductase
MSLCCSSARRSAEPQAASHRDASPLPVAIIGGGPVGLAAATHLLERGIEPIVLEAGPSVGTSTRAWGHVRMFSPWRYNIDKACRALVERHGWTAPDPGAFPTGHELAARYLEPLANVPELAPRVRLGTRVTAVARAGQGKVRTAGREAAPFDIRFEDAEGREGRLLARAVLDASGTWGNPNPAGASGLPAPGEREAADRIRHGMPDVLGADRGRYAGRRVMVLGSGDSALSVLIDLARLADQTPGTAIIWATRNRDLTRAFGGGAADQLPERGALGMRVRALVEHGVLDVVKPFAVDAIGRAASGRLLVTGLDGTGTRAIELDEMVVATGLRPDIGLLREVRLDLDPALDCPRALAPLIDPNVHSCGTVRPHGAAELEQPDPGLFIVGMKSYGRAPTFLLATGYEQVRSIAAFLAGDLEAARRVELDLPQTGVCSATRVVPETADAEASCRTPDTHQGVCCPPKPELVEEAPCRGSARREIVQAEAAE